MRSASRFPVLLITLIGASHVYAGAHAVGALERTISVTAAGSVVTAPNQVTILSGVTTEGASPSEALNKNSAAMARIVETLKREGIAPIHIQTTNFSVRPVQDQKDPPVAPTGYRVNNSIRVVLEDMAKLGPILDKVVNLGATNIGGIEFSLDNPEATKNAARKIAFSNALAKAKLYAEAAGVELGEVLSISEDATSPIVQSEAMEVSKQVPIEAGSTTVAVQVHVSWALK